MPGESSKASPKEYVYNRVPGLTHFPYPARDEEWHQELQVSQPWPRLGARHSAYAAASPASLGGLGAWYNLSYAELHEDARENPAATSSEGLSFLSGPVGAQGGTACCVYPSCARLQVQLTIKKMSCYWLMEEGNVHLLSSPSSLPKEE